MNKLFGSLMVTMAIAFTTVSSACACTSIAVGKDASQNGAYMFARTEDHGAALAKRLKVYPRGTHAKGDIVSNTHGYTYTFTQDSFKFVAVPDMVRSAAGYEIYESCGVNEHGLSVSATNTTYLRKQAKVAGNAYGASGFDESIMTRIVLAEARTASEAVDLLGRITERDGMGDRVGCTAILADKAEMWLFETVGRYRWVASRVPDDSFVVIANDMVTDFVNLSDRANFRGTPDIKEFAVKHGFAAYGTGPNSGDVNIAASYGENNNRYNSGRRWRGYDMFAPSRNMGIISIGDGDVTYPMYVKPDRKISLQDVMKFTRDRYCGTSWDLSLSPRVTVLSDEGYDIKETLFYDGDMSTKTGSDADSSRTLRPVGINTQKEVHIVEVMPGYPPEVGARIWLALAQAEHSVFLPMYGLTVDTSKYDRKELDKNEYSSQSAFWQFQNVAYYSRFDRVKYGLAVRDYWRKYESVLMEEQKEVEKRLLALYEKDPKTAMLYITSYVISIREHATETAMAIRTALMEHIEKNPDKPFTIPPM